jgi:hypothetical protein
MSNQSSGGNYGVWLRGLLAAFIGGGSGSVTTGLTSMGIDPDHFNLRSGLGHTLELMGVVFLLNGVTSVFLYLKQSPLPPVGEQESYHTILNLQTSANTPGR